METADARSSSSSPSVRKSLRAHKRTPQYRALLEQIVQQRETAAMSSMQKRRLRLDKVLAGLEIEQLKRGEALTAYTGIMALHDPLRGLLTEVEE
jgi:hypothetical protein